MKLAECGCLNKKLVLPISTNSSLKFGRKQTLILLWIIFTIISRWVSTPFKNQEVNFYPPIKEFQDTHSSVNILSQKFPIYLILGMIKPSPQLDTKFWRPILIIPASIHICNHNNIASLLTMLMKSQDEQYCPDFFIQYHLNLEEWMVMFNLNYLPWPWNKGGSNNNYMSLF